MTDFERQVLEALKTVPLPSGRICYGDSVADDERYRVLYSLAPRVATAIEAAAWDKTDPPWAISPVRLAAGLAALRGDHR